MESFQLFKVEKGSLETVNQKVLCGNINSSTASLREEKIPLCNLHFRSVREAFAPLKKKKSVILFFIVIIV